VRPELRGLLIASLPPLPIHHRLMHREAEQVANQVPSVLNLNGNAISMSSGAIARDNLNAGILAQPAGDCLPAGPAIRRSPRSIRDGPEWSHTMTASPGPIIDPEDTQPRRAARPSLCPNHLQQCSAADRHCEPLRQARSGLTACSQSDVPLHITEPASTMRPCKEDSPNSDGNDYALAGTPVCTPGMQLFAIATGL
jgi:hypothetical protein